MNQKWVIHFLVQRGVLHPRVLGDDGGPCTVCQVDDPALVAFRNFAVVRRYALSVDSVVLRFPRGSTSVATDDGQSSFSAVSTFFGQHAFRGWHCGCNRRSAIQHVAFSIGQPLSHSMGLQSWYLYPSQGFLALPAVWWLAPGGRPHHLPSMILPAVVA